MHTISDIKISSTLDELHLAAGKEMPKIIKGLAKGVFRKLQPVDMKDTYIAISRQQGAFLYDLLVRSSAKNIVEFGTSFGISTLYLGAAAKYNQGKVITTELLPNKCAIAQKNFDKAGLSELIDLRAGDALETLKTDLPETIDFLLLDGWNDLYLPILNLLEPRFKTGTLVYTDNTSFKSAKPLLDYLYSKPQRYRSRKVKDDKGGALLSEYFA